MRVLQIVKGLDIGGLHGGAERFAIDLALELRLAGLDVQLCAFFATGSENEQRWVARLEGLGLPVFFASRWQGGNHLGSYRAGLNKLSARLRGSPAGTPSRAPSRPWPPRLRGGALTGPGPGSALAGEAGVPQRP